MNPIKRKNNPPTALPRATCCAAATAVPDGVRVQQRVAGHDRRRAAQHAVRHLPAQQRQAATGGQLQLKRGLI